MKQWILSYHGCSAVHVMSLSNHLTYAVNWDDRLLQHRPRVLLRRLFGLTESSRTNDVVYCTFDSGTIYVPFIKPSFFSVSL